jgi:hypothetical protein
MVVQASNTASCPNTFTGANGRVFSVTLARCRQCDGTNWGPTERHTPDGTEVWHCLDCYSAACGASSPRAGGRDATECPNCGPYTLIEEARGLVCYRCRRRFRREN